MKFIYKGREVEILQMNNDVEEPMIEEAQYLDGEEEFLTDEEMDELLDVNADAIQQEMYERAAGRAEDLYDMMMGK